MLEELKKKVEEGLDPKVFAKQLIDELDNDTVLDVIITSFDEETIQNALQERKEPASYLMTLSPVCSDKVWLPKIGDEHLERLSKNDNRIVIAHDWFSQGAYEYGAYTLIDGKIKELQSLNESKIVNEDGDYIFELGTLDHKGLIAIEVPKEVQYFVMERSWDLPDGNSEYKETVRLYFEPGTSEEYIQTVQSLIYVDGEDIRINKSEWLSLYADDYKKMIETMPVQLI